MNVGKILVLFFVFSITAFLLSLTIVTADNQQQSWYAVPKEKVDTPSYGPYSEHSCYDKAIAWTETHGEVYKCFPQCEFEDGTQCVWDAKRQGNGSGQSFVQTSSQDQSRFIEIYSGE